MKIRFKCAKCDKDNIRDWSKATHVAAFTEGKSDYYVMRCEHCGHENRVTPSAREQQAMSADADADVIDWPAESASEEDVFFKEWGKEALRQSLSLVNESLQRLVTLNTTLIGGSFVLLREELMAGGFRVGTIFCFLLSLAAALLGSLPRTGSLDVLAPGDARAHTASALKARRRWLLAAASALLVGFVAALLGLVDKLLRQ